MSSLLLAASQQANAESAAGPLPEAPEQSYAAEEQQPRSMLPFASPTQLPPRPQWEQEQSYLSPFGNRVVLPPHPNPPYHPSARNELHDKGNYSYGNPSYAHMGPPQETPAFIREARETWRSPSPTATTAYPRELAYPAPVQQNSPPMASTSREAPPPQQELPSPAGQDLAQAGSRCTDFVAKLWFLLDRPEYSKHIRWNASGDSFIFFATSDFANEVLARLFKHSNIASFVRQLNLYGFQRISHLELLEDSPSSPNANLSALQDYDSAPTVSPSGFMHASFIRGRPATLGLIRPKTSGNRVRKAAKKRARDDDDEGEMYPQQQQRRKA